MLIGITEDKLGTCCDQLFFGAGPQLILYRVFAGRSTIFLSSIFETTCSVHYDHDLNSRSSFRSGKEGMTVYRNSTPWLDNPWCFSLISADLRQSGVLFETKTRVGYTNLPVPTTAINPETQEII